MKTHYNDVEYAKKMLHKLQRLASFPPPIPFEKTQVKNKDKDEEKDRYKSFEIKYDANEKDSDKMEVKIKVFEDGTPEDYVKWMEGYKELEIMKPLTKPLEKLKVVRSILKGSYLETFNSKIPEAVAELTEENVEAALGAVALKAFKNDPHAYRRQVQYMRYHLYFTTSNFTPFLHHLRQMNQFLRFFPVPPQKKKVKSLPDDQLIEIIDNAKPLEYHQQMLQNNYDPFDKSLEAFAQYIERLETSAKIGNTLKTKQTSSTGNSRGKKREKSGTSTEKERSTRKLTYCKYCEKKVAHDPKECFFNPANKKKREEKSKRWKSNHQKQAPTFTGEQLNFLIQQAHSAGKNKKKGLKKRQVTYKSDSESDKEDTNHVEVLSDSGSLSDNEKFEDYFNLDIVNHRLKKKSKRQHAMTEVVGEIVNKDGKISAIRILLDSGTSSTIILRDYALNISKYKHESTKWRTMGGMFKTRRKAQLQFKLPEFSHNKKITWVAHVDEHTNSTESQYDMIIGSDLMEALGITLCYKSKQITWDEVNVPMKDRGTIVDKDNTQNIFELTKESSILKMSEDRHNEIIQAMYGKIDITEHVKSLEHLTTQEQEELSQTLEAYPDMYQGAIGTLNIAPVHFELKKNARPYHARPFPIPKAYETLTKEECRRFAKDGIWHHTIDSVWAAPSFIVPKKTGDVRVVTDFRELNKWIVRKPYPLPKILDILQKMERFKYATAVDLRKGYYHIPLDKATQKLCTTVLPWGKYSYERLPMGIATSPDIFQKAMNDIFGDLDYVLVYLDDILILSNDQDDFKAHLKKVQTVFARLHKMGMKVNLMKTEFFKQELEYLGYLLTRHGIKPMPKKVEAIQRIKPPKTKRQLRRFLGMINYYRDMWKRRSHILAPLSALISKTVKYKWTEKEQRAFEEAKRMLQKETMLAYPKFGETFHIYADASDTQLGGVIMQDNKPLAFYTRKLNNAQSKYTTGEQELLSIVETLKSFENILMGQKLVVHTDHLNLLYKNLASARLIRWRMLLEEFGPTIQHVKGEKNVVADALSRLDMTTKQYDNISDLPEPSQLSYVTQGDIEEEAFPMLPKQIRRHQQADEQLINLFNTKDEYKSTEVEGVKLITYKGRIYIPETLKHDVMKWYHTYLMHPGATRMLSSIQTTMHWHGIRSDIDLYVKQCTVCQRTKKHKKKYGHLPPKIAETTPWKRVNVDFIGPYTIKTKTKTYELRCMTMIDPVTSWFEIARIIEPTSNEAQQVLDSIWLARYPRPQQIGFDNGSEFKHLFRELCDNMGIKPKMSTDYNPQGNSIVERIHQVLGNQLRSFELEDREFTKQEETFEPFLTACAYAIRCTYHTTLKATPGQLVFGRDMILPIQFEANWALITKQKQDLIDRSNQRENKSRLQHQYQAGQKVLLKKPGKLRKMQTPYEGPYEVQEVFPNGTITILKGVTSQRVNI